MDMAGPETPPAVEAPPTTTGNKKGLSKYMSRMKTILRGGSSSKRLPSSSTTAPVAASSVVPAVDTIGRESSTDILPVSPTKRSKEELERVRRLAQKYKVELDTSDWRAIDVAERVEKPIRMRIHRTCHICGTSYGANKTCATCEHHRCDQCPRYPKKKVKGGKGKDAIYPGSPKESGTEAVEGLKRKHEYVLTLPSKTGGQDLVLKRPMQRVRRNCHLCNNVFMPGNKACSKCNHVRCGDCPRDPPKKRKHHDGYLGDAPGSGDDFVPVETQSSVRTLNRPRRKVRYCCHNCHSKFKPTELTCQKCGHEKCNDCPRVAPKKIESPRDPEIVQRVQEKLQALGMGGASTMSETTDPPPEDLPEVDPAEG